MAILTKKKTFLPTIQISHINPNFWQKHKFLTKIKISSKNLNFKQNLKISKNPKFPKKNQKCFKNQKFSIMRSFPNIFTKNIKHFQKIRNFFVQKLKKKVHNFGPSIKFSEKLKFLPKIPTLWTKLVICQKYSKIRKTMFLCIKMVSKIPVEKRLNK